MSRKYPEKTAAPVDKPVLMQQADLWYERPVFVLVFTAICIFVVEACIMLFFWRPVLAPLERYYLHASVLTLAILPMLYLLVLRPRAKLLHQCLILINALQTSREIVESIVSNSADGSLVLDQEGVILYVNPAAEQLLQKSSQHLLGSMFGFPVVAGESTEIEILRNNHQPGTAEMRITQTDWHGEQAILVSLRDISNIVNLREQLREQSLTDELTGLYNRRGFLLIAEQQLKVARRTKVELGLLFIDLDRFKQINDTLGHKAGDQTLIDVADILRTTFRDSDIIARFGGDEFNVLATDADKQGMDIIVTRLQETIVDHNQTAGRPYQISISYGVSHYDVANPVPIESLIERADQLMYEQKHMKSDGPEWEKVQGYTL